MITTSHNPVKELHSSQTRGDSSRSLQSKCEEFGEFPEIMPLDLQQNFQMSFTLNDQTFMSGTCAVIKLRVMCQKWWFRSKRYVFGELSIDLKRDIGLGIIQRPLVKRNKAKQATVRFQVDLKHEKRPGESQQKFTVHFQLTAMYHFPRNFFPSTFEVELLCPKEFLTLPETPIEQGDSIETSVYNSGPLANDLFLRSITADTFDSVDHDALFDKFCINIAHDNEENFKSVMEGHNSCDSNKWTAMSSSSSLYLRESSEAAITKVPLNFVQYLQSEHNINQYPSGSFYFPDDHF